nr:riboflavin synthase subunit alpha [uncultured Rhodopila sp.]
MFTGIVHGAARIDTVSDHDAIRTFVIDFPEGFCDGLAVGASVSVDGVCLTATEILSHTRVSFDVIYQTLKVTTLSGHLQGQPVNVERAARDGAEIGGHPISGHVDFSTPIETVDIFEGNKVLRIAIPDEFAPYIFAKGYIAINGVSLTLAEVNKAEGWLEIWLIPETRRVTTFDAKRKGDRVNIEIERNTQVVVDTIRLSVKESLGKLQPLIERLLLAQGIKIEDMIDVPPLQISSSTAKHTE